MLNGIPQRQHAALVLRLVIDITALPDHTDLDVWRLGSVERSSTTSSMGSNRGTAAPLTEERGRLHQRRLSNTFQKREGERCTTHKNEEPNQHHPNEGGNREAAPPERERRKQHHHKRRRRSSTHPKKEGTATTTLFLLKLLDFIYFSYIN